MMRRFLTLCSLPLSLCLMGGCTQNDGTPMERSLPVQAQTGLPQEDVVLRGPDGARISLRVEVARTDAQRDRGLMGRPSLPDDGGMLFVFEREEPLSFWMKNTLLPLDILFFDARGRLVSFDTMHPCMHDPCPTTVSEGPAQYALEVVAGTVAQQGVDREWRLVRRSDGLRQVDE